jgi:endo-1,4-beta-xylanase
MGNLRAAILDESDIDARIENLRKGDFTVRFVGAGGEPLANNTVSYTLTRHDFSFGTCLSTRMFRLPEDNDDRRKYLDTVASHFNYAVHENALKWYAMERQRGRFDDETPMMIWRWCHEHNIAMRGHCIFWGSYKHVQPWVKQLPRDELEAAMMHGDYYAKMLGLRTGAPYFKFCKGIAPAAIFYVNDYNVLSGRDAGRYVEHIRELIQAGADVGGIGCQGHFRGRVRASADLWERLNMLAQFDLPIKITEFDIDTRDRAQQAQDLRRFYRVCFAHPAVSGILMWGFWEGAHWRPNAALWRADWSMKPAGEAYTKLVTDEWFTRGKDRTDERGQLHFRGFFGTYRFDIKGRSFAAKLTRESLSATAQ